MRMKTVGAKKQSGFTLIEVIVVTAIFAILAAIAIPAFSTWGPKHRLKSAAGDIYGMLQFSKLTAVKENASVVIWFDTATNTYHAFLDNGAGGVTAGDNLQTGAEQTIREGTIEDGIDMYNTVFSTWVNQTSISSRGVADGGWGRVSLKNSNNEYMRIVVWLSGYLEIETSDDGVLWN